MSPSKCEVREATLPVTATLDMFYRDFGPQDGRLTPVICLHGYWRTMRDFGELAAHLASRRRVVTPDLRGRGRSGRSTDVADYHYDRLLGDVLRLMETLGIARAAFVGTALGAQLAMDIANLHPERVAGVALNDSGAESNAAAGKHMATFSGGEELTYAEAFNRIKAQYAGPFPRFGDEDWARYVERGYRRTESGKYVRDFDQLTNHDLNRMKQERPNFWKEFAGVPDVPIAILRGANSTFLTSDIAERMLAVHPRARLYTIPDVGHPPALYERESLDAVDSLLAEVDAAARETVG